MLSVWGEPLMMRFQVRTFAMPRWIGPLLALAAIVLLPFALMLALGLAALALGALVFRALMFPTDKRPDSPSIDTSRSPALGSNDSPILDAEYEVKEEDEEK